MQLRMNQEQENKPNAQSNTNSKETSNKSNILTSYNRRGGLNNNQNTSSNGNKSSANSVSSSSTSSTITDVPENTSGSCIKVGADYQAILPEYNSKKYQRKELKEREFATWQPAPNLTDTQIDDYLKEALLKHSYNIEQALGFLFYNKHNISKALSEMNKYVPKPDEWTQEEKILFEQAYSFNGKNFSKIRQILPDKTIGNLVTYYYNWKKSKLISQIEVLQNSNKNSTNNEIDQSDRKSERNGDNASDDNDSVDDNFNSNVNTICANCDFITNVLQSTTKGQLCIPCFTYYKQTSLMRPDHVINKSLSNNNSHRTNYSQNGSLLRTNRYLTISNTTQANNGDLSNSANNISTQAKNFHKSLRKPPKGIYLNYDELIDLVQAGAQNVFEELKRKNILHRNQTQSNKQEIELMIKQIAVENDSLKSEINDLLFKSEKNESEKVSPFWSQKEISLVLQAFQKYGEDFEGISDLIETKSPESIKAFYNYYKDSLNLDKLILNSKELGKRSQDILSNLKRLNRSDVPVKMNGTSAN
ncbi:unnamed protein product [Brachionus calyciflorus]|uniref:Uncharacterized protein n=1 Tax=Brachionus calyciflorus TaxID=104777 RepID=A0A813Q4C5_9BILA|nr:unnamed protein product [Brachionus calyciflorus]